MNYGLEVICRDTRNLIFVMLDPESRRQAMDILSTNAFPLSHNNELFAFSYQEELSGGAGGWEVYGQEEELHRWGGGTSHLQAWSPHCSLEDIEDKREL